MESNNLPDSSGRVFFDKRRECEWLSSKDAALFLCISEGALRNLVYRGQITFYKFGRRLRFRISDIESLLKKKGA